MNTSSKQAQSSPLNPEGGVMEQIGLGSSSFGYSTIGLDALNNVGTRFTLVTAVNDISGSTSRFLDDMEAALGEVIKSCSESPEKDTFLFRMIRFGTRMEEMHGFLPLSECDPAKYAGALKGNNRLGGTTLLYDTAISSLEALRTEAKRLGQADFDVNAVLFIITDGMDNESSFGPRDVRREIERVTQEEFCESILPILIGVNVTDPTVSKYLSDFSTDGGFAQYVELKDASKKTLAKLAKFISQSASSQSQSLGTGGPSKPIDINAI